MRVRSKSSGKVYDVDYLVAEDHAFSLSEVDIDDTPTPEYDYEELRNLVAAKLFIRNVEQNSPAVASNVAIEEANHLISELKKSPVE
jgi:hypothetical protein